jgi:hypothetical protein
MPPKIRDLIRELTNARFVNRGGKGSDHNFMHASISRPIPISGKLGNYAKPYRIKAVAKAVEDTKS